MKAWVTLIGIAATMVGCILLMFGNEYGGIPLLAGPVVYMMAGK